MWIRNQIKYSRHLLSKRPVSVFHQVVSGDGRSAPYDKCILSVANISHSKICRSRFEVRRCRAFRGGKDEPPSDPKVGRFGRPTRSKKLSQADCARSGANEKLPWPFSRKFHQTREIHGSRMPRGTRLCRRIPRLWSPRVSHFLPAKFELCNSVSRVTFTESSCRRA